MEEKEVLSSVEKEDIRKKNLPPLERIREEFLETEESYVSALRIIVKVKKKKIKKYIYIYFNNYNIKQVYLQGIKEMALINQKDNETIFSNVETIHQIHERLLEDLKNLILANRTTDGSHQSFGDLLKGFVPFLKMYTVYINGFNEANKKMKRLQERSKKFNAFLKVTYSHIYINVY